MTSFALHYPLSMKFASQTGTTVPTTGYKKLLLTSESMAVTRTVRPSASITNGRVPLALAYGTEQGGGTISAEYSHGLYDEFLESGMYNTFDSGLEWNLYSCNSNLRLTDATTLTWTRSGPTDTDGRPIEGRIGVGIYGAIYTDQDIEGVPYTITGVNSTALTIRTARPLRGSSATKITSSGATVLANAVTWASSGTSLRSVMTVSPASALGPVFDPNFDPELSPYPSGMVGVRKVGPGDVVWLSTTSISGTVEIPDEIKNIPLVIHSIASVANQLVLTFTTSLSSTAFFSAYDTSADVQYHVSTGKMVSNGSTARPMTIEKANLNQTVQTYFQFPSALVNTMSFSMTTDGPMTSTFDIISSHQNSTASISSETLVEPTFNMMDGSNSRTQVSLGGTTLPANVGISSMTLNINNSIRTQYIFGTKEPANIYPTDLEITGEMVALGGDSNFIRDMLSGANKEFAQGSYQDYQGIAFHMPNIQISAASLPNSGRGEVVRQSATFSSSLLASSASQTALSIVVFSAIGGF